MKSIFTLLVLLSIGLTYAQEKPQVETFTCEKGTQQAIEDAKNKEYKLISYGLLVFEDWEFEEFYWQYMEQQYGIKMGAGGCMVTPQGLCYANTMKQLIVEEFGANIFEKGREEAKEAYKKV